MSLPDLLSYILTLGASLLVIVAVLLVLNRDRLSAWLEARLDSVLLDLTPQFDPTTTHPTNDSDKS